MSSIQENKMESKEEQEVKKKLWEGAGGSGWGLIDSWEQERNKIKEGL